VVIVTVWVVVVSGTVLPEVGTAVDGVVEEVSGLTTLAGTAIWLLEVSASSPPHPATITINAINTVPERQHLLNHIEIGTVPPPGVVSA